MIFSKLSLARRLKFQQLAILEQVLASGSISAASRQLHMTQPAISKAIQELEEHFGQPLLARSVRGVHPTDFGLMLMRHSETLMAELRCLADDLNAWSAGVSGLIVPYPTGTWMTAREAMQAILQAVPALLVPGIISITTGVATPTESAAVASLVSLLVGLFVYKEIRIAQLGEVFVRTALASGLVIFLVATAGVFGWAITFEQIPQRVAEWISASTSSPFVFLMMVMALLLAIGMVLDGIAALILVVPILLPIATSQYGISPFHFGVVISINLVLGLLTPPVGTGLFVASAMAHVPPLHLFRALMPFLLAVCLLLVWLCWDGLMTLALIN